MSRHVDNGIRRVEGPARRFGTNLLEAAVQWAARSDRILLRMIFSTDNWPMRKLAHKAHARLDLALDQVVADIPITRVHM